MKLTWESYELELTTPLRISRSTMAGRTAVRVVLTCDGVSGHGEVVTSVYFGLDCARIIDLLTTTPLPDSPEALLDDLPDLPPGVRAALDAAAHDLIGRRDGLPVHTVVGHPTWTDTPTAYTIGISTPTDAARLAQRVTARGFTLLKLKLGSPDDAAVVAAVRSAAPNARLLVDPNGAWSREHTVRFLDSAPDIDAIEQPVAPGRPADLAWVRERSPVALIADEDATTVADVRALAGAVDGVNVKLAKCGGVRAAMEIIGAARAGGMDVMLGCLVASSLGIAPAAHLAGAARWVDLDGHLLLADDPWTGIGGGDGVLRLSGAAGLGVTRR